MTAMGDVIVVSVPLDSRYLATVRLLAASLAADAGFSVDEIDDLRLALSESLAVLLGASDAPDRAVVEVEVAPRSVVATVRLESGGPVGRPDDLATTILRSVTDEFDVGTHRVRLVKVAHETVA